MIKGSSSSVIQKTEVEAGECKCFPRIPSIKGPIPCHWICYSHTQKVGFEHNCLKHKMRQNVTIRNVTFCLHLPCEQLVSPTLVQESNRLIFHRACAKYVTPHVMYLTSLHFLSRKITTQQARPNAAVTQLNARASAKTSLLTRFTGSNLIYSSLALDGGSLKETNGCSQWFLSREA